MRSNKVNLGMEPFTAILMTFGATMTADSLIKSLTAPSPQYTEMPGKLLQKSFDPQIAKILQESEAKLKALHKKEMELAKEQKVLAQSIQRRAKLKEMIVKYGPVALIAGVGLGVYFIAKRR